MCWYMICMCVCINTCRERPSVPPTLFERLQKYEKAQNKTKPLKPSGYAFRSVQELLVHDSHRLKAQSYLHATCPGGSICECGLSVHDSHRLKAQSYLHATYSGGSVRKSGLSVLDSFYQNKCSLWSRALRHH